MFPPAGFVLVTEVVAGAVEELVATVLDGAVVPAGPAPGDAVVVVAVRPPVARAVKRTEPSASCVLAGGAGTLRFAPVVVAVPAPVAVDALAAPLAPALELVVAGVPAETPVEVAAEVPAAVLDAALQLAAVEAPAAVEGAALLVRDGDALVDTAGVEGVVDTDELATGEAEGVLPQAARSSAPTAATGIRNFFIWVVLRYIR